MLSLQQFPSRTGTCALPTPVATRRAGARRTGARRARRRGQTLIEFAFVATVLLLLSLGLVQFAILANASLTLSQVAREGARYAAVNPYNDSAIQAYVKQVTPAILNKNKLTITVSPAQGSSDRAPRLPITVTCSYNLGEKLFLPSSFFGVQFYGGTKSVSATYMIE